MREKQIEERKKYLALQWYYFKSRELIQELERKLDSASRPKGQGRGLSPRSAGNQAGIGGLGDRRIHKTLSEDS